MASHDSPGEGRAGMSAAPPAAAHTTEPAGAAAQAQQQTRAFLAGQKDAAADHIDNLSQVLHGTVDQLREKSPGAISDYAERAVHGLDSVAAALRQEDMRSLVGTVEEFARRQPALFLAGSAALGFALARFLKSSAHADHDHDVGGGRVGGGPSGYPSHGSSARGTEYRRHFDTERHGAGIGSAQAKKFGHALEKESE
jgi:hypothetical protein